MDDREEVCSPDVEDWRSRAKLVKDYRCSKWARVCCGHLQLGSKEGTVIFTAGKSESHRMNDRASRTLGGDLLSLITNLHTYSGGESGKYKASTQAK